MPFGTEPIRGDLYSADRLEQLAETIARHRVSDGQGADAALLARVRDNGCALQRSYRALAAVIEEERLTTPAAEWLVDNGNHRIAQGPARLDLAGPFIVADGMGGQLAGEQASRIAVEVIPKELAQRLGGDDDAAAIRGAIAAANQEIIAQAHIVPECTNMGTTVVLATIILSATSSSSCRLSPSLKR